jgi:hypothetical protein
MGAKTLSIIPLSIMTLILTFSITIRKCESIKALSIMTLNVDAKWSLF